MITRGNTSVPSWRKLFGVESHPVSHRERLISVLGVIVGMVAVVAVGRAVPGAVAGPLLVLSIGSTAVLLFAVPHGALSQPWPVFGGHLVAAAIGVACARHVPDATFAAVLAAGLATGAMHYLRCMHPPAGATALAAVLGGEAVRAMGYGFVVLPVMLDVLAMLAAAVVFNAAFPWRRYPAFLARNDRAAEPRDDGYEAISHEDFVYALTQMDSFIDISEDDLLRIYSLATGRHRATAAAGALSSGSPS